MKKIMTLLVVLLFLCLPFQAVFAEEGAYNRVLKTQTLRCGYNYYEPVIMRNEQTGKLVGVFPEYMEALGKAIGIKVEWTSEVGWGDVPAALKARKIDAMCAGTWADAKRGMHTAFTHPIFYNAIEVYGRADDTRFDKNLSAINDPSVTISALDGSVTAAIAQDKFPAAKLLTLPTIQHDSDQLLSVSSGKADVTFLSNGTAFGYMKANPHKIKRLAPKSPLRVHGVTIAVDIKEQKLLSVLNTATDQLINSGEVDKILDKYETGYPGTFSRVATPYVIKK